jgi:surface antigen
MQKRLIKRLLIGLLIVNLTACASHSGPSTQKNQAPALEQPKDIFLDTSVARFMDNADHQKLQDLIATAQAEQLTSWYSDTTGVRFEFTSKRIFVNPEGQGCRDYQIRLMRGFLSYPTFNYTACRDSQGVWQVVAH